MIIIRDRFINKIKKRTSEAMGTYAVLTMGIQQHKSISASTPNASIYIAAGPPNTPGVRAIKYVPTHSQIQMKLTSKNTIIFELFLSELVQDWFDFLAELYEEAIDNNLFHAGTYSIPSSKLKIDLSLTGNSFLTQIKDASLKDFDFLQAKEKLKNVSKTLQRDLTHLSNQVDNLRINIKVRNILQHNGGIITINDLSELGVSSIEEDHGSSSKTFNAGQRISRTAYDIENFVDALIDLANSLVP